jgi:hypothetical protein
MCNQASEGANLILEVWLLSIKLISLGHPPSMWFIPEQEKKVFSVKKKKFPN